MGTGERHVAPREPDKERAEESTGSLGEVLVRKKMSRSSLPHTPLRQETVKLQCKMMSCLLQSSVYATHDPDPEADLVDMPGACSRPDLTLPSHMTPFNEDDLSPLHVCSARALTSCGLERRKTKGYEEGRMKIKFRSNTGNPLTPSTARYVPRHGFDASIARHQSPLEASQQRSVQPAPCY